MRRQQTDAVSLKKNRLWTWSVVHLESDETHAHQPEALLRPEIHSLSELEAISVGSWQEEGGWFVVKLRVRILNSRVLSLSTTVRGIRDSLRDADLLSAVGSWVRFLLAGRPPEKCLRLILNLTASAGVAPNKFLAKLASD